MNRFCCDPGRPVVRCLLTILLVAVSAFAPHPAWAQKVKHLRKADTYYAGGDYAKAIKSLHKYKSSLPAAGAEGYWSQYHIREARLSLAQGLLDGFDAHLDQAIQLSVTAYGARNVAHAATLLDVAEIYNRYGYPRLSRQYVTSANTMLDSAGSEAPEVAVRAALIQAEALILQGWGNEAISLLRQQEKTLAKSAVEKENYVEDGAIKTRKVPEAALEQRFRDYARCLMLIGAAYSEKGSLIQADSAFTAVDSWLQGKNKYLGETNIVGIENRFRWAHYMIENGNTGQRERLLQFDVMLNDLKKRIKPTNQLSHDLYLTYLHELMHNQNRSTFNSVKLEYQKVLEKNFPKKSLMQINMKAVEFDARLNRDKTATLEQEAVALLADPSLPPYHPTRERTLLFLYNVSLSAKNYARAETYLDEALKITGELYGESSPHHHLNKLYLANFYLDYTNKIEAAKALYAESYDQVLKKEIDTRHKDILDLYNHLAFLYEMTDQYALASEILKQASASAMLKYRSDDILYGIELTHLARLRIKVGDYDKAANDITQALTVINDKSNRAYAEYLPAYVAALETQARLYGIQGLFDEAQANLEMSAKIIERSKRPITDDLSSAEEQCGLLIQLGRYSDAETLLATLFTEYRKRYGAESIRLIQPLVEQGQVLLSKGEYTDAERTAQQAYRIAVDAFGEKSTKTAPTQKLLSDIYYALGDYDQAEVRIRQALDSQEKQFGRNHIDVARSLSQLALIRFYDGDNRTQVESLMLEAKDIMSAKLGDQNPQYAEILKHLAVVYLSQKKYDMALSTLERAAAIWRAKAGSKNNINLASIYILWGDVFYQRRDFDKAEDNYRKSMDLYEKFFSTNHPEYVKGLAKLSKVAYMKKNFKASKKLIEEALTNYESFIEQYFPALSEREKARYWNTIRGDFEFYNTLAFSNLEDFRDLTGKVYDYQLLTKALLLSSSMKVRERIMTSADTELKDTYNLWLEKKEMLTRSLSLSTEQLMENEIQPAALQQEVERLEKALSTRSEDFARGFEKERIRFDHVSKALGADEVAVEMVRFRYFDHVFTDSIIYAALYLKKDYTRPKAIVLGNGKQIENRYFRYYRNAITGLIPDRFSYDAFWAPLYREIGLASAIYFSADGVYNQINLEAIPTPDGRYVIDNANIVLVSNTRDLVDRRRKQRTTAENTAFMFGNPTFYLSASAKTTIPSLPGTEQEVTQLDFLLKQKGWQTNEFIEREATEEQLKAVRNPRVFHIATHGLYKRSQEIVLKNDGEENESSLARNPLLRTGLLLKGAGDLLNKTDYNYNLDNGILTAYEAMSLHLDQTDLVVLSACETGLGDVEQGEGVYGLQRAFLVAGARVLIMSMFKVDDKASQQLMVKFYQKWLNSGRMRESFIEAKRELRTQFPEPLYWGAFMMIGLE